MKCQLTNIQHAHPKEPEVFHDDLFRVGESRSGAATYTPRALIFDTKFTLRSLPLRGGEEEEHGAQRITEASTSAWSGAVHKIEEPSAEKSLFHRVREAEKRDDGAASALAAADFDHWTDILSPRLHSRSLCVCDMWEESALLNFHAGYAAARSGSFRDRLENDFHFYLEECNRLQGIQVTENRWIGTEREREEYNYCNASIFLHTFAEDHQCVCMSWNGPLGSI